MAPGSRYYTLLFIPDDERRTISFKVHAGLVRTLAGLFVLFGIGAVVLMVRSGSIALQLQLLPQLQAENRRLKEDNERLEDVRVKLARVEELDAYLQSLAVLEQTSYVPAVSPNLAVPEVADTDEIPSLAAPLSQAPHTPVDSGRQHYSQQVREATPYITPVRGWMTRAFVAEAAKARDIHRGVDYAANQGSPIYATAPGIVESVVNDDYLGKLLTIRHMSGFLTRYGHCAQILVLAGQHVQRGQTVATVGSTGKSSAPHLHYEVIKDGKQIDPLRYIVN